MSLRFQWVTLANLAGSAEISPAILNNFIWATKAYSESVITKKHRRKPMKRCISTLSKLHHKSNFVIECKGYYMFPASKCTSKVKPIAHISSKCKDLFRDNDNDFRFLKCRQAMQTSSIWKTNYINLNYCSWLLTLPWFQCGFTKSSLPSVMVEQLWPITYALYLLTHALIVYKLYQYQGAPVMKLTLYVGSDATLFGSTCDTLVRTGDIRWKYTLISTFCQCCYDKTAV